MTKEKELLIKDYIDEHFHIYKDVIFHMNIPFEYKKCINKEYLIKDSIRDYMKYFINLLSEIYNFDINIDLLNTALKYNIFFDLYAEVIIDYFADESFPTFIGELEQIDNNAFSFLKREYHFIPSSYTKFNYIDYKDNNLIVDLIISYNWEASNKDIEFIKKMLNVEHMQLTRFNVSTIITKYFSLAEKDIEHKLKIYNALPQLAYNYDYGEALDTLFNSEDKLKMYIVNHITNNYNIFVKYIEKTIKEHVFDVMKFIKIV